MLRVHGCMFCYINLLFVFLCMRMPSHVYTVHCGNALEPGASVLPYYGAPFVCVLNGLGGVSGVASHTQTNKQTFEVRVNLPTLCVSKARCGFQQVCILILMKFRKLIQIGTKFHVLCGSSTHTTYPTTYLAYFGV